MRTGLPRDAKDGGGHVALIDEARCIGCTLCLEACPVDAIVGANRLMHSVIAAQCTGCELCLPPCPVDCIAMVAPPGAWTAGDAASARIRARKRKTRLALDLFPGRKTAAQRHAVIAAALKRKAR